ncbi:hypothetical protein NPIL_25561 [Nephila pilipes]|uniref:Uncharacterized protein n=1 Tax=Nephila pilipes TaxID=299642 RepID=A0A8X6QU28_NEPPI|nr:hypothetical protein NPIL_25561 [Nephila pilipes]
MPVFLRELPSGGTKKPAPLINRAAEHVDNLPRRSFLVWEMPCEQTTLSFGFESWTRKKSGRYRSSSSLAAVPPLPI